MPLPLLGPPARRQELTDRLVGACTPNEEATRQVVWLIYACWLALWLGYWTLFRPVLLPSLPEVLAALPDLWTQDGLGQELLTSWWLNLEALVLSTAISMPLAYLSRTPAIRPLAVGLSKLRFLSPGVFFLALVLVTSSGHDVKVLMLTLGESFFLVTTMVNVVGGIPAEQFDDARTLRMSEWRATWYVVVRGTLPEAIDAIRDNAAMGWSMLTMIEGIVQSEGGVGVLLVKNQRHLNMAAVYAIALAVVAVGLLDDRALGAIKSALCQWAALRTEGAR